MKQSNTQRQVVKTTKIPGLGHHTFTSAEAEWYSCVMKSDERIKNKFEQNKYTLTVPRNPLTLSDNEDTKFLLKIPKKVEDNFFDDVEMITKNTIEDGKHAATKLIHIGVLEERRKAIQAQLRTVELQMSTNRVLRERALMKIPDNKIPLETKFRITKVDYNKVIRRK